MARIFSLILIIFANIIPIYGIQIDNWKIADILALYLLESVTIAFWSILKIKNSKVEIVFPQMPEFKFNSMFNQVSKMASKKGAILFFIQYFSIVFLIFGFMISMIEAPSYPANIIISTSIFWIKHIIRLIIPIFFFLASYSISYYQFINNKTFEKLSINQLISNPMRHLAILYITIFVGMISFVILYRNHDNNAVNNSYKFMLYGFIAIKIMIDLVDYILTENKLKKVN